MKVIASSFARATSSSDDGQLYVVLSVENFHPGKGTPTTQIDMRRISDGVKTTDRYKTTDQVERAFVEDRNHIPVQGQRWLHFMNTETFDQVAVPEDILGDQAVYLEPKMAVTLSMFDGVPVAIELPRKATLEVVETEPAIKSQTQLRPISRPSCRTARGPWCRRS